ncbi:DNA primase [Microbacterium phage Lifes]|nr:DNA primase [Microbacterium phage Lifes]
MATADNVKRAESLTRLGLWVFPVYVRKSDDNPYKTTKKPGTPNGFYDATNDPGFVSDLFEKHPKAEVGVWMGPSGLVAADIDVKRDPEGNILVDGWENFDLAWLDLPETHSFDSISGAGGKQFIYLAPEGLTLGPDSDYRGIKGVDRRAGGSYSVWNGPVPESRDVFKPAPEWLLDEKTVRSAEKFEGDVREWFDSLEEGEPSLIVRAAMDRARDVFEKGGNDYNHSDLVERQFEAVRLGSEGHPGVPQLLGLIEELFMSREGAHSRGEEDWAYEFTEALATGIQKHGGATALRKALPDYSLSIVPASVPDRLVTGAPGNKEVFRELLAELVKATEDDNLVTSVLWNSPRTREISREWGLEFVAARVKSAREKPEPIRENPTLPVVEPKKADSAPHEVSVTAKELTFLSDAEEEAVALRPTFIDIYRQATDSKGFTNPIYVVPVAWTALSMAFGYRGFVPLAKSLECNLWFTVLGESTTGKGTEDRFLRAVLNLMFLDGETENYNLGAMSSPDGLHLGLINRDKLPSIIHNDEAADFFRDIKVKDWMMPVPDKLAKWFDGWVEPSSKISLKDARGKSAHTSLNQLMWGTPDRVLELLDASQFESGYLARVNWVWDGTIPDPNRKSNLKIQEGRTRETPDEVYDITADLLHARHVLPERFPVSGTQEAQDRLNRAADDFRAYGRKSGRWSFIKPAVDRLVMETLWKVSALNALYRGEMEFDVVDALTAITYAREWLKTMMKVAESISESPYSRDVEEMESFIRDQGGTVSRAGLLHHFRGKVMRSARELDDRIGFLVESGRVNRIEENRSIKYVLNG